MINIYRANKDDVDSIAPLISDFRAELDGLRGLAANTQNKNGAAKTDGAAAEFFEYINAEYPVYVYKENDETLGYVVCRVEKPVVWVESLFVARKHRRKGIASALFSRAEELAASYGEEMVYNNVHPNNYAMIDFLRGKGYDVLNLIELRKQYSNEEIIGEIAVGNNEFKY